MVVSEVEYGGWKRNLRLANDAVELIVSLDVGPRVLSFRPLTGANIFHNYASHLGGTGEGKWMSRGGHRFWIAPEDEQLSYSLDNSPFPHEITGPLGVQLINPGTGTRPIQKKLSIELAQTGSSVRLVHTLRNESAATQSVAPWALSVMAPGGTAFVPQPPLGEHPRDLLPNRALIFWSYSDPTDPRFRNGRYFITLRQEQGRVPFKFGLLHRGKWAAYLLGGQLFVKTVAFLDGATYPDLGCNFESYTDTDMLEVETLGPLVDLAPGASCSHVEEWRLHGGLTPPDIADSETFAAWLQPYLP